MQFHSQKNPRKKIFFTLCNFTPEKKSEEENIFDTLQFHSQKNPRKKIFLTLCNFTLEKKIRGRKYFLHFAISLPKKNRKQKIFFTVCDFTPEKKIGKLNIMARGFGTYISNYLYDNVIEFIAKLFIHSELGLFLNHRNIIRI